MKYCTCIAVQKSNVVQKNNENYKTRNMLTTKLITCID